MNTPTDRFKKLTVIISIIGSIVMILGIWYTISVTYNKVGETVEDQTEINNELKAMHLEFDEYKIETMERHYQIELKIKNETIERLESDIEHLKEFHIKD